jgi:hypothetical protein
MSLISQSRFDTPASAGPPATLYGSQVLAGVLFNVWKAAVCATGCGAVLCSLLCILIMPDIRARIR